MVIQWYPGHMAKALRQMQESLKIIDVVCYVLDSRAPKSCINPEFKKLTENKPCLFVLNKSDLADKDKLNKWQEYLKRKGADCIKLNSQNSSGKSLLVNALQRIEVPSISKLKLRGVYRPIRVLVIGVPNCGKSTLINLVGGKKVASTGDKPGVTKGKQWVRLCEGIELMDTPGTLWPSFEDETTALHLAFIGSIKDDIIDDFSGVTLAFIKEMIQMYPKVLEERYKVAVEGKQALEVFEEICLKRGFIIRKGEADFDRGAKAIIDDYRKGRLGNITLDMPDEN